MKDAPKKSTIDVKVLPRSSKDAIVGEKDGIYKIKLTAPAIEGKANKALLKLLAKKLGLPTREIKIISGERSRMKSIQINRLTLEQVKKLLLD
ncbi:MAG: YggU family protein [Deltaproteobacteria bacterium]|nr:YggU family protein [Deltaproteobacteria bacterium]